MSKYIKVMGDYCSTGIWHKEGYPLEYSDIPISERLKIQLEDWVSWYDKDNIDYLCSEVENEFPVKFFSEVGLAIAKQLKRELPDYTIEYFDEFMFHNNILDVNCNYEIEV